RRGEPAVRRSLDGDRHARPLRYPLRQEIERREQAQVVQENRPDLVGQLPELLVHLTQETLDEGQPLAALGRKVTGQLLEGEVGRGEKPPGLLVQRVRDSLGLLL